MAEGAQAEEKVARRVMARPEAVEGVKGLGEIYKA